MAHSADVAAEELTHAGLPGHHDGEAAEQRKCDEEPDAPGDDAQYGSRPACVGGDAAGDEEGDRSGGERQDEEQSEEGGAGARSPGRLLRDVDPTGSLLGGVDGLVRGVNGSGGGGGVRRGRGHENLLELAK